MRIVADDKPLWRNDIWMSILAIISIVIVYQYDAGGSAQFLQVLLIADAALVGYFLIDFAIQTRQSRDSKRFLIYNWWKLLGMIPMAVTGLGFFRLLRLVRIFYVLEKIPAFKRKFGRFRDILGHGEIPTLAIASGSVTLIGSILVWLAERNTNPNLADFGESVWWAIVTVTTVGYGDITPITKIGRAVAVILMVTGIGTIGMLASQVSTALVRRDNSDLEEGLIAREHPDTLAGTLSQLALLHSQGKLSDDEFATAKARVLDD